MGNKTIIVLEDDGLLRSFYCLSLEEQGYQVIQASNSGHILELIASHKPILVISDLIMPDHEGMEGIFKILEHHSVPIIAISAYKKYLMMVDSLVAKTLLKPITNEVLIDAVKSVLNKQESNA